MNLKELIESIIALYSGKLAAKGITVEKELEYDGQIVGFQNQLAQVFSNLFLNALEACRPKGKLRVRVYAGREWTNSHKPGVRVVVADTGNGIRPEDRPRLFEPFFTTKGEKGTGLGLWVSQGIINRHNGFMRFRSSVSPNHSGTVFSVFLPADAAPLSKTA